jgi:hypothetical protein
MSVRAPPNGAGRRDHLDLAVEASEPVGTQRDPAQVRVRFVERDWRKLWPWRCNRHPRFRL